MAQNLNMSSAPVAAPAAATPSNNAPAATQDSAQGTNAQSAVAAAVKAPQTTAPASSKKKYQLKVDGRQEDFEFDPSNEEDVKKQLQLARVGQKRMQQFSEYENNVKDMFALLQSDPIKVLSDPRLGITEETRKRMAEMIINNEIEELQKTPEQRDKEKLQRDYENLKKQHEQDKTAREAAEFQRVQQQYASQLDTEITDAIEKSGLPKTSRTVKYFAEALMFCNQNNIDLSAKDLGPLIRKQTMADYRELVGSLPDDELEDFIGKDTSSRLRKRSIQRIKNIAPPTSASVQDTGRASQVANAAAPASKVSARDFFKNLGGNSKGQR